MCTARGLFLILPLEKINLRAYIGYFGLAVLLLGIMLLRQTTAAGQAKKKKRKEVAAAFEKQQRKDHAIPSLSIVYDTTSVTTYHKQAFLLVIRVWKTEIFSIGLGNSLDSSWSDG